LTCSLEDVVEEVLEAIEEAKRLRGESASQAVVQSALNRRSWRCAEPISVGDDYSIVFKVPGLKPPSRGEVESLRLGEVAEPIRNFPLVLKVGNSYLALGVSALRVSLDVDVDALKRLLKLGLT